MSGEPTFGGIVLAAGEATRFGSPKQLAMLGGQPLLQHVVDAALAVPALWPLIVVLGSHADEVRAAVDVGDAEVHVCPSWAEGQSASLRAGVRALDGEVDWALVLLGDQPTVTPQVIAAVMDTAAEAGHGVRAVRVTHEGRPGHPVALSRALFADLLALEGDHGARDLLRHLPVAQIELGHLWPGEDVDTPEDMERLRP
jgi:molybdenum cofactor cytidylyltransferase